MAGCLAAVVFARSAGAQDMFPPPLLVPAPDPPVTTPAVDPFPPPAAFTPDDVVVTPPEHLVIKNQYFESSPAGFRDYLETIKSTNPQLFAQLTPDADRLVSRRTTADVLLAGGLGAGVLSVLAGVATRRDCPSPSITDPKFAADLNALSACDQDNNDRMVMFGLLGLVLAAGGMAAAFATMPSRQDLLDVVNKHNRLSPDPLRLQIGYDPGLHTAQAGATLSF